MNFFTATVLFAVLCIHSVKANEESPVIVYAVVEKVERAAPFPDTRDAIDLAEGVPPPSSINNVWIAELKIERVLSGDKSLAGQMMTQNTMEEMPAGNSQPVTPLLKKGDEGIFAIKRFANGMLGSPAFGRPVLPEGRLPLIKGRDAGFEKALARLTADAKARKDKTPPVKTPESAPSSE